jgi:hypothetical protein
MKPLSRVDGMLLAVFAASASILLLADSDELVYQTAATKSIWAFASSWMAFGVARRLWDVPEARWSWLGMAGGLGLLALGDTSFSFYQVVRGVGHPFPSIADVFYVLSYPVLILALLSFVVSYRAVLPMGGTRELAAIAVGSLLVLGALAALGTRPVLGQGVPLLEKGLLASYVWLDVGLVLPLVLLARAAFAFRGGGLAWAWGFLLGGFLAMKGADLLYSLTPWLEASPYPYLDEVFYTASYLLILEGMLVHRRLLT